MGKNCKGIFSALYTFGKCPQLTIAIKLTLNRDKISAVMLLLNGFI